MKKTYFLSAFLFGIAAAASGLSARSTTTDITDSVSTNSHASLADDSYTYQDHLRKYAHRKYGPLMARLHGDMSEDEYGRMWEMLEARELAVNGRQHQRDLPEKRLAFDQQCRSEFGAGIADSVATYLKTIGARGLLARVNMLLLYKGVPLTREQIERLSQDMIKDATAAPRNVASIEDIRAFTVSRLAQDEMVRTRAKAYLSPVQLEALTEEMEFQISSIKIGMLSSLARKQHAK